MIQQHRLNLICFVLFSLLVTDCRNWLNKMRVMRVQSQQCISCLNSRQLNTNGIRKAYPEIHLKMNVDL